MKLVVAHTPDPDDSFMFYGMFENKIKCAFQYDQVVKIENLFQALVLESQLLVMNEDTCIYFP